MGTQALPRPTSWISSSTVIAPLPAAVREQLRTSTGAAAPAHRGEVDGEISQLLAKLTRVDATPQADARTKASPPAAPLAPARAQPSLWKWTLAGGLALSLAGNVLGALGLRVLPVPPPRVAAAVPSAPAPEASSAGNGGESSDLSHCMRDNTQIITGPERDRLLLRALRAYETGQRAASLSLFKLYVSEACDTATLQAVTILERELAQPKKELAKSP